MIAPEQLQTTRLRLRRPQPEDAPIIFANYAGDALVTRYLSWPRHRSMADTQAFIQFSDEQWHFHGMGPYLIETSEGGALIGSSGLTSEYHAVVETGYVLARHAWGQGYATEVLRAMVELATTLGMKEIQALCHVEHHASAQVLRKCSFVQSITPGRKIVFPNLDSTQSGKSVATLCFIRLLADNTA